VKRVFEKNAMSSSPLIMRSASNYVRGAFCCYAASPRAGCGSNIYNPITVNNPLIYRGIRTCFYFSKPACSWFNANQANIFHSTRLRPLSLARYSASSACLVNS
jgi:hypothetical protein